VLGQGCREQGAGAGMQGAACGRGTGRRVLGRGRGEQRVAGTQGGGCWGRDAGSSVWQGRREKAP